MEHIEAVNVGATERYLLGELPEDECTAFEQHYFSCAECAADVRAAAEFIQGAAQVLSNATGSVPGAGNPTLPAPRPGGSLLRFPHRGRAWFYPMPLGAAAALVLSVLSIGGLAWQGSVARSELARATAPQPASWAFLSVSRAEPQVVTVGRAEGWLGLTLSRSSSEAFPYYRCRLSREGAAPIAWTVPAPEPGGELQTALPLQRMSPGRYELALDGLLGANDPVGVPSVAAYQFSLHYRGE